MPVMDGVAAWIEIKKLGEQTAPIVALTANAMEGDRNKYIEAGMDDYITKPITFEALEVLLAKWLMQVEGKGQIQEKPSEPTSIVATDDVVVEVNEGEDENGLIIIDNSDGLLDLRKMGGLEKLMKYKIERLQKLAEKSIRNIEEGVPRIINSIKNDMDACKMEIHTLKGVVQVYGAHELGELMLKLEDAIVADELNGNFDVLLDEISSVGVKTVKLIKTRYKMEEEGVVG